LGASGAIRVGFAYALEHGFDWSWVFDADSVPEPEAHSFGVMNDRSDSVYVLVACGRNY
jgi:hypothetical protein